MEIENNINLKAFFIRNSVGKVKEWSEEKEEVKERAAYPKGRDEIVYPFGRGSCIRRVAVRRWEVCVV